eukprot:TRINITY_DN3875_c0_g1_i1.p1 TRINITY_DN3875_c0_g1~~TRINITY_DN3875_c0_g1_i1.p1  ORF type:complete len:230 (-),score=101.08 TRINITY_DN3875_c0_g1_i1:79-720(-)
MEFATNFIETLTISKLLSLGILAGATFLKVPQIRTILKNNSVEGLSLSSVALETLIYSVTISYHLQYGYPFYTFGEAIFIIFQLFAIDFLILSFGKKFNAITISASLLFLAAFALFLSPYAPLQVLDLLQSLQIVFLIVSRVLQIFPNFKNKSVGALSIITVFMQFGGSAVRVYTTYKDVNDMQILVGYATAAFLNFILLTQCVIYGSKKKSD